MTASKAVARVSTWCSSCSNFAPVGVGLGGSGATASNMVKVIKHALRGGREHTKHANDNIAKQTDSWIRCSHQTRKWRQTQQTTHTVSGGREGRVEVRTARSVLGQHGERGHVRVLAREQEGVDAHLHAAEVDRVVLVEPVFSGRRQRGGVSITSYHTLLDYAIDQRQRTILQAWYRKSLNRHSRYRRTNTTPQTRFTGSQSATYASSALSIVCSLSLPSRRGLSLILSAPSPMVGRVDWNSSSLPPTCWITRLAASSAGPDVDGWVW
jgi:hypothetical protein